ncbi:MAG TPA: amidase [Casimicrobiaceae bacterium]|nr:amidase [Casimicrobiaceae bacterium]
MDVEIATQDFCASPDRLALAERQLAALAARESVVRAFAICDVAAARAAPPGEGPLAGALIGVKDIITTADFPTRYGADDAEERGRREDAWCVAQVRRLGATILGKTACTEFAYPVPGPTTNPHDATRTPGGSSGGSAAAVAAGFVSFAFGTQTAASTVRPASYCGVTGYKPSYGLLPLDGVQAISTTLDHLGIFARSPRDAWYLTSAMLMRAPEVLPARAPRRVLILDLPVTHEYGPLMAALAASLARDGIAVDTLDLPFPTQDFTGLQQALCYWEAARILSVPGPARVVPQLEALLAPYAAADAETYAAARRRREQHQAAFQALAAGYDAVLTPAATGPAPSRETTGDAIMSRFFTALHVPAFSVPIGWTDGLPLGLQLLGRLGEDRALAATAQWFFESTGQSGATYA